MSESVILIRLSRFRYPMLLLACTVHIDTNLLGSGRCQQQAPVGPHLCADNGLSLPVLDSYLFIFLKLKSLIY